MVAISDTEALLRSFLKTSKGKIVHLVLEGAVVSGKLEFTLDEPQPIYLHTATVYSGGSIVKIETLTVPFEGVRSWGYGKLTPAELKSAGNPLADQAQ